MLGRGPWGFGVGLGPALFPGVHGRTPRRPPPCGLAPAAAPAGRRALAPACHPLLPLLNVPPPSTRPAPPQITTLVLEGWSTKLNPDIRIMDTLRDILPQVRSARSACRVCRGVRRVRLGERLGGPAGSGAPLGQPGRGTLGCHPLQSALGSNACRCSSRPSP